MSSHWQGNWVFCCCCLFCCCFFFFAELNPCLELRLDIASLKYIGCVLHRDGVEENEGQVLWERTEGKYKRQAAVMSATMHNASLILSKLCKTMFSLCVANMGVCWFKHWFMPMEKPGWDFSVSFSIPLCVIVLRQGALTGQEVASKCSGSTCLCSLKLQL